MKKDKVEEFVIVDIETTGLTPVDNEVIEIGAVRLVYDGKNFKQKGKYHTLIKPYKDIPINIQNLTGISPKLVEKAPRFEEIYLKFLKFLGDSVFVAHNVQFDLQMLNVSIKRVGGAKINNATVDSQQLVAIAFPTLSSHKLGDVARHLKIDRGNGHRALDDAIVTAEVFKYFTQKVFSFKPAVLSEINKLLKNHSWPLKEIFIKAQEKAMEKTSADEMENLHGWKSITQGMLQFEKLKRPKRGGKWEEVDHEELADLIADKGALSKQFKSYEHRAPQKEMLKSIIDNFNGNGHLMVEAGTGTGKTIAYLLPAIYWAMYNGTPVVIATRTKNLQAQLLDKDVPLLKKVIGQPFNALLLKGRENYVCLRRVELTFKRLLLEGSLDHVINFLPLLTWLAMTENGDLSELHLSTFRTFFKHVKSETASCLGDKCALHGRCFLQNIRKQAKRADVLVINHALLFTDLAGDGFLLPEYKHLIIDEAHAVEEDATESFSLKAYAGSIGEELKRLQALPEGEIQEMVVSLRGKVFKFFELIHTFVTANKRMSYGEEKKVVMDEEVIGNSEWKEIKKNFKSWHKDLDALDKAVEEVEFEDDNKETEVKAALANLKEHVEHIVFILDEKEGKYVHWMMANNATPPYNSYLRAAPIEIGPFMQEYLFEKKDSVVLTSATLTVADEFKFFLERLGFEKDTDRIETKALGSSFNYEEQFLFCVPKDFPAANDEDFVREVKSLFMPLFELTQGRALVLFTSYSMLQKVYNKLRIDLEKKGINILCQGKHGSRRAILNRFKENPKSILFGTDSFWEGVDIPGKELSCVVMMKLPFAVPTEPVIAARLADYKKKGKEGFFSYSVPQAIIKFRQGLGRLIRTKDDKGVVILLDNRVLKKNYGKVFLRSIPGKDPKVLSPKEILSETKDWLK